MDIVRNIALECPLYYLRTSLLSIDGNPARKCLFKVLRKKKASADRGVIHVCMVAIQTGHFAFHSCLCLKGSSTGRVTHKDVLIM